MRQDQFFSKIVESMIHDYPAYYMHKKNHYPKDYMEILGTAYQKGTLTNELFFKLMNQYIACLKDRNIHLYWLENEYQSYSVGFKIRFMEDGYYVNEVNEDTRVSIGDQILELNGSSILKQKKFIQKDIYYGRKKEEEFWSGVLKMCDNFTVKKSDGTIEKLTFSHFPLHENYVNSYRVEGKTLILTIQSFEDASDIKAMMKEIKPSLSSIEKVIIDIRRNCGGDEEAIVPLLAFLEDKNMLVSEFFKGQDYLTFYTQNNKDRKIFELEVQKQRYKRSKNIVQLLDEMIQDIKEKEVNSMVKEPFELHDKMVKPISSIKDTIVITDVFCETEGELFADIAKHCSKVTILGRPTLGTHNTKNNVMIINENKFMFSYPMSIREHVRYDGVKVDKYIPVTKEELSTDVLLHEAMKTIKG